MSEHLNVLPSARSAYAVHRRDWRTCVRCQIGEIAHHHVFVRGTLPCSVLFVGEAPGKTEDATGQPFVGKAGKLLDIWIKRVPIIFTYAITNTVLCRPCDRPGGANRAPTNGEVFNCRPRLTEFITQIAKPKIVIAVGRVAQNFLKPCGRPQFHIKHPAWANYNGGEGSNADKTASDELTKIIIKALGHHGKAAPPRSVSW